MAGAYADVANVVISESELTATNLPIAVMSLMSGTSTRWRSLMVNAAGFKEFTCAFNARDPVVELLLRDPDVWAPMAQQLGLSACRRSERV